MNNECAGVDAEYDKHFRNAVYIYYPEIHKQDWCWLKAQCIEESNLQTDAVSGAGAEGLCQFLRRTFADYEKETHHYTADIFNPYDSIYAAAWYMGHLHTSWYAPRTPSCRRELAQGSYNCGLGCLLAAQRKAGGAACFEAFRPYLPKETRDYVDRIHREHLRLTGGR